MEPMGLSASQIALIRSLISEFVVSKVNCIVYTFGSRAIGGFRKYSDLDIWIEAEPNLTDSEVADLSEKFEESDLPFKVDIVTPERCHDDFKAQILSQRKLWFQLP